MTTYGFAPWNVFAGTIGQNKPCTDWWPCYVTFCIKRFFILIFVKSVPFINRISVFFIFCIKLGQSKRDFWSVAAVALNGETSDIGEHTQTLSETHTHIFMPKLMRQIYDGCWPQQIKLTVMYVGGRVSRCTYRPHTHLHTHTSSGPLLPVLLVRLPCQAAPLQHTCIMKSLDWFVFFFFPLSCIPRLIQLLASCPWRTASRLTTTGQCVLLM